MTDKEVEKRFLFDLEMGRFKEYTNNRFAFKTISKHHLVKFTNFLNKIGYSENAFLRERGYGVEYYKTLKCNSSDPYLYA